MTGGGSMLKGLCALIEEETKVPVRLADDAEYCVAYGTGKVLDYIDKTGVNFSGDDVTMIE